MATSLHLVAAQESVDQTLGDITWETTLETLFTTENSANDLVMRRDLLNLIGAMVGSPTMEQARLIAQSFYGQYREGGPDFPFFNRAAEPVTPAPWWDLRGAHVGAEEPLVFDPEDRLQFHVDNDGAGAGEDVWGYFLFASGKPQPDPMGWRPYRFTVAPGAITAETWTTSGAMTADQALTPGTRYAIGGGFIWADTATVRAARLTGPGLLKPGSEENMANKPPIWAGDAPQDWAGAPAAFRPGAMGSIAEFWGSNLPRMELHADAADNLTYDVALWLKPVGRKVA